MGPTLPDLELQTKAETDQMSYVLTAKSFTNFAGAFLGNRQLLQESHVVFVISVCFWEKQKADGRDVVSWSEIRIIIFRFDTVI